MKHKIIYIFIVLLFSIFISSCNENFNELKVDVIDVGQGDSILIITPNKKTLLVDSGEDEYSRNVIRNLKENNVKKVDFALGTHSDSDHIGAMDDVIEEIPTENIILSKDNNLNKDLKNLFKSAKENNVNIIITEADNTIKIDENVYIHILSPSDIKNDPNKNSIVFILEYNNYSLMFTGDADSEIESAIVGKYSLEHCDFLKAGHHGSKTSSSKRLIETIRPDITAISCGHNNRYGHPSDETLKTLKEYNSKVYRTDLSGTLQFHFTDDGIFISQ